MTPRTLALRPIATILAGLLLAAGAQAQGVLDTKKGKGGSEVQGAAGTQGAQGAAGDLEKCDKPMGAVAVVEPQDYVMSALSRYNLQSPVGLIRMMIQQSNCFIVVERGQGMQNMMQERALAGGGEMRSGSNIGGGQMVAADFILTPAVVFNESNAGGIGGALGGLLGGKSAVVGAVAGGLKFKEAQTSMLVSDSRSGVQVASAEGSTKKADLGLGIGLFGGGAAGGVGGYGNTNEGKIIAASFADNYNNVVRVVRNDPSLQRDGRLDQGRRGLQRRRRAVPEDRRREAPRQRGRSRQGGRDARQGRGAHLHGRRAERLPAGRVRQGWRLGQEDPRHEIAGALRRGLEVRSGEAGVVQW
jgi:curli biogenesis system outer membrane secretion channel CsgG